VIASAEKLPRAQTAQCRPLSTTPYATRPSPRGLTRNRGRYLRGCRRFAARLPPASQGWPAGSSASSCGDQRIGQSRWAREVLERARFEPSKSSRASGFQLHFRSRTRCLSVLGPPTPSRYGLYCRSTTEVDHERHTASPRKVWRRAGDSNSETPCGVVDFKTT